MRTRRTSCHSTNGKNWCRCISASRAGCPVSAGRASRTGGAGCSIQTINTGWANSKFDETIKAAGSQLDEKDRLQGYIDAETILIKEDCVVSPMATNQVQQFYQPYMRGYTNVPYTDTSYMFYYTEGRGAN